MLRNAINYFAGEIAGTNGDDVVDGHASSSAPATAMSVDHIVGSVVDVGGIQVRVRKRIGEGGFAFVYAVEQSDGGSRPMALKRLLAADAEKRKQTVQEITFLKRLKPCPRMLQYVAAANLPPGRGLSATKCEEFLLLTELCVASLFNYLCVRPGPYPAKTVAQIFFQTLDAVAYLHRQSPPIVHRDLKCENLLIDATGAIKLCDLGSATTSTYAPDPSWNMARRTAMEEELQKYTTPMYRSPEMVDIWSNYAVGPPGDVWALACLLYQLCFHRQAFDDGAKLSIINGNYQIPDSDVTHRMFHDLIRQMLAVDPEFRPSCGQVQEHLGEVGIAHGWDLEEKVDFDLRTRMQPPQSAVMEEAQDALAATERSNNTAMTPSTETRNNVTPSLAPAAAATEQSTTNVMSSFKVGAGSMFRNIKDTSKAVVSSLLATKDVDLHLLTSRVAAMSCPSDGMDLSSYKNSIEDIRQIMEARHSGHYAIFNLCEKKYQPARFPSGHVIDAGWTSLAPPSLEEILNVTMRALEFLGLSRQNVITMHCVDGRSNTAVLFSSLLMVSKVFNSLSDCLNLFELKRCEPVLSCGQRAVLKQLERVLKHGPSIQVRSLGKLEEYQ
jgi:cyclin G-associated kinase